jgi:hypothetical protein
MQRLGLVSSAQWFPTYKFFIPFADTSPIIPPPPIQTFGAAAVGTWINRLALNLAPYAAYYLCDRVYDFVDTRICPYIYAQLPKPAYNEQADLRPSPNERRSVIVDDEWHTVPESPTLGAADREIRHGRNPEQDVPTLQALEGQGPVAENGIPLGAIRRQSTFSSRGGDQDYGTDEEDAEMVNPTLISFDVDTTESNEQPTGVWSAELRPSFGGDGRPPIVEQPVYMVNQLTSLPSVLGADILSYFVTSIACAPFEAVVLRAAARAFARGRGLSSANMYEISILDGLSWRNVGNVLGLEIVRLLISGELWAMTSIISQRLHITEDEWRERHKEKEAEKEKESRESTVGLLETATEAVEMEI